MSRNKGVIYALLCPISNKIRYIGQTIQNPNVRLQQHLRYSIKQKNHLGYWINSLKTIPILKIIEECEYTELDNKEIFWINFYNNCDLVNSMRGNIISGHHTHSEETKKKIAAATIKIHTGLKRSEETKEKIRKKALGRKQTEQQIHKRLDTINNNGGYICSEETKLKISNGHRGKTLSASHKIKISDSRKKYIHVYNIKEKEYIVTCIKDFSRFIGVFPNSIHDRLKKYPDNIYRDNWVLSYNLEKLKVLLNQLGIK